MLTLDVTVTSIAASNPMLIFNYVLNYGESALTVQTANHDFLLFVNPGSSMLSAGDPIPDTNNDDSWTATVVDTGIGVPESGSGVLSRLTISTDPGATTGVYNLTLTDSVIVDLSSLIWPPDAINNASIAVNRDCAAGP